MAINLNKWTPIWNCLWRLQNRNRLWYAFMVPEAPAPFLYISLNNSLESTFDGKLSTNRTIQPLEPDIIVWLFRIHCLIHRCCHAISRFWFCLVFGVVVLFFFFFVFFLFCVLFFVLCFFFCFCFIFVFVFCFFQTERAHTLAIASLETFMTVALISIDRIHTGSSFKAWLIVAMIYH